MNQPVVRGLAASLLAGALALVPLHLAAQGRGGPKGPARAEFPRLSNAKPDFSGVWERPYVPDMTKSSKDGRQKGEPNLPFTAKAEAVFKEYDAAQGDYTGTCMPFGLVRSINSPHPMQIVQSPSHMSLLFEQNTWFHVFPTDGRPLPKDPDPTWFGTTVGRWEGDKLVAETIGFNGYTKLDTIGHPHSASMKVIQTFEYRDPDHIAYTITIDDPKAFTRPWSNSRVFTYRPDWQLLEYSCEENNKDVFEGLIKPWIPSQNPPKL